MPTIILSGRQYRYILTRKPILSLRLRLTSAGSFSVSAPLLMPQIFITRFLSDHSSWIIKNSSRIAPAKSLPSTLVILEIDYQLIFNKTSRDSVVVFDEDRKIFVNSHLLTNSHLKKLLDKKLRVLAAKLIKLHLTKYDFKYSRVSIRNQSSRFGSCSGSNNLSFNWQIILFPLPIFQHILLHELTHTIVKNHSPKFWNLLAVSDPDWRSHRFWLKKEGHKLMIFS